MIPNFLDGLKIVTALYIVESKELFLYVDYAEKNVFLNTYELVLEEIQGEYYAKQINHEVCAYECFCGLKSEKAMGKNCEFLTGYVDEIFEQIKEHPKVRLHLLFL